MVVPILLTLAFLGANLHNLKYSQANEPVVISVTNLAKTPSFLASESQEISESQAVQVPDWYFSTVVSFFSASLAVNALVTGLIIYKILTVYRGFQSRVGHTGLGRDISPVISIVIESGVITFVAQLVQTLMFRFANTAHPIIVGLVAMLYVRAFKFTVNCWFNDFWFYLSDCVGNFDGNRSCARRDGPYLRCR